MNATAMLEMKVQQTNTRQLESSILRFAALGEDFVDQLGLALHLVAHAGADVELEAHAGAVALRCELQGGIAHHAQYVVQVAFNVGEHGIGLVLSPESRMTPTA